MTLRRIVFPLSLSLGVLLVAAAPSLAQRSQPQHERVGLYLTQVIRSDQRISRSRVLYLPPQAAAAITTKPSSGGSSGGGGKKGGGGSGGGGGSATCPTTSTSTYSVGCPVAPTTSMPEAEEEIAADPGDATGQTYVAAVSDFSLRGGYNTTKWAITTTGGGSGSAWAQQFVPLNSQNDPITSDGMVWAANSDPDVAIDGQGNVYLSDLYLSASAFPNGIYVSSGTVANLSSGGNFTNTEPVMVNTTSNNPVGSVCNPTSNPITGGEFCLEDKPWIAVDNSTSTTDPARGVVYVVWDHFSACNALLGVVSCGGGPDVYLSYSTNHGLSWSAPITIDSGTIPTSPSLPQSGNVEAPQVAVGPHGTVYVAYEAFDPNSYTRWQYFCLLTPSESAGGVFSLSVSTAPFLVTPQAGFQDVTFSTLYRVNSFPALAIGPNSQVFLEYADQPSSNAQVEFVACATAPCTSSTNFSAPQAINATTTGQEFFPAVSVDSNGVVNTSWFDTRNSPNNTADFDVYSTFNDAYTASPGSGWAALARVTPTTINTGVASFIGDYAGIASPFSVAHPVWNDLSETCGRITCKFSGTMQSTTLTLPTTLP